MNADTINLRGISVPVEELFGHCLLTGTTGSGKTTLLLGLLEPLLALQRRDIHRKAAAVVFDVKGDLLRPITNILKACDRESDLVVLGPGSPVTFNPLAGLTPQQITQLLITISTIAGQDLTQQSRPDDLFWSTSRHETLAALTELAALTAKSVGKYPLCLPHLLRLSRQLYQKSGQLTAWVDDVKLLLSESATTALEGLASLPDNTRSCIATSVSGVLGAYARPPLRELITSTSSQPGLNLADTLFQRGKVIVITAGQAEQATELLPLMIWFKAVLFHLVLARRRRPELNQERPLWIAMDEFTRTFLPHTSVGAAAEHVTLEMARASGVGFILAAQNLSGLETLASEAVVQKMAALCRNVFFFQNTCPVTARLAQTIFGHQTKLQKHITEATALPAPWLIPQPECQLPGINGISNQSLSSFSSPHCRRTGHDCLRTGARKTDLVHQASDGGQIHLAGQHRSGN